MSFEQKGSWPTALEPVMRVAMTEASHQVGKELLRRVQTGMLNGPKSGRVYNHPNGGTYTASAPEEYSAVVTGDLYRSVNYAAHGNGVEFYATSDHAAFQEYGTVKMEPRENLYRAIVESDGEIHAIIDQIVGRALRGGGA